MKCKTCGQKATVNMRHHKLALCSQHYLEWVPEQTARFIKKYWMFGPDERVLVAVSGGKDSLSLWDILHRLGYQADGLYLGLGIDEGIGYSDESHRLTEKFASERGLKLHVVDIEKEYGSSIPMLAQKSRRGQGRPCSVCGVAKRHEMNRIARDLGYDVLATGHNLDDEVAVLFANTISWSADLLRRQEPVLRESDGLARKVKPLCRFGEKEMTAYALLRGIEYIYEECPFSVGSTSIYYKELLNQLEHERPGAKLAYYVKFLEAKKDGLFTPATAQDFVLTECPQCGQPTSGDGLCSFCKIIKKAG
ncbi:MAG: tRNA(Ile)-lysidine synthetase [Chloroflexi bacterium HGW-Chloroflexi-6]|nr:MAG: tRNA(Ile)-lysidine synthetase [Chloroflexi bacterium HGW-Chloroflexi-6]